MAFGRNRSTEPPLPVIDWRDVEHFVISDVERGPGPGAKRPVLGGNAVRVPRLDGQRLVKPPCAFLATPSGPSRVGTLYEDRERQRLLCTVDRADGAGSEGGTGGAGHDGERRYVVRDERAREIGVIRRVPPSKQLLRCTWRIEQPGHPEIVGRNKWVAMPPQGVPLRVVGKFAEQVLNAVFSPGGEDGDGPVRDRTLLWVADGAEVMQSVGSEVSSIKAEWLDRRLAFAMAVVGDR
ncbi:hypothetical protein [Streptomyces huiliensis]|uniref:hypothetical protein n=1 Tax=Streptomyces huiliensis TaxID=2876027 RepID=UPI001CBF1228|nr:hypothetical protein [Streptomyces huiliensis]MBZ4323701.1 hypothetical protein [Streptomyces huiliensis]